MEIICGRKGTCGFRAHERYFLDKTQFTPGICPVCNGPVVVVEDGTDTAVANATIESNGRVTLGATA